MSRPLSLDARRAIFAQETGVAFIYLLTINHPDFVVPIRVASDPFEDLPDAGKKGVISRGEEFIFTQFEITPPTSDDTGVARAQLVIDNVDREIVKAARRGGKATITVELVLSTDVHTPETTLPDFRLEKVGYDALTVSGDISMEYYDLEPYPYGRFHPSYFPGMY